MTDKLVIAICMASAGAVIGLLISRRLKNKKEYFNQFDKFLMSYSAAVGFSKNTLPEVLKKNTADSKLLIEHLSEISSSLSGGPPLRLKTGYLSTVETKFITEAVLSLGKNDTNSEKAVILGIREDLKDFIEKSETSWKKYGSASIKLGFLFGLLLAVLFM